MTPIEKCPCDNRPTAKAARGQSAELDMTRYVVYSMLGRPSDSPSQVADKLLRLVKKTEHDNGPFFAGVCKELKMSAEGSRSIFNQVADEIFAEQQNWGRVVSFCTFSVKVAEHFQTLGAEGKIEEVIRWTAEYLRKLEWIESHGGGWVSILNSW